MKQLDRKSRLIRYLVVALVTGFVIETLIVVFLADELTVTGIGIVTIVLLLAIAIIEEAGRITPPDN